MIIKYRTWFKGIPPRKIKLQIPGWAGDSLDHQNGAKPQPWHCQPFVDGSTYGLELIYPFNSECIVKKINGEVKFLGNFKGENPWNADEDNTPPFSTFAPNHYGFTSSLDIMPPIDYVSRIEPHPRFFTDTTGTVPIAVTGHIQHWWPKIFFVAFKSPLEGQEHIFRKDEPYAQVIFLPRKADYQLQEMSPKEKTEREIMDRKIALHRDKIANHTWRDHLGNQFDDKYKQLSSLYAKYGKIDLDKFDKKENGIKIKNKIIK